MRKKLLERRKALPEDEFSRKSDHIIKRLRRQAEFSKAKTVHCFVSMNERREVNTHDLVREMISNGKRVVVPVTNFSEGTLRHLQLDSFDDLESNKWGVLEPDDGREVKPAEMDLVIVPMVGGDEGGNRLGYGEGFYDRFLKGVSCPKIGLLFEKNVIQEIPVEDFDIPMDKIITEDRVIQRD